MTFLDCLNLPKFNFTQNRSGGKIIKFQQSQALTSHFEIFWSIVHFKMKGSSEHKVVCVTYDYSFFGKGAYTSTSLSSLP